MISENLLFVIYFFIFTWGILKCTVCYRWPGIYPTYFDISPYTKKYNMKITFYTNFLWYYIISNLLCSPLKNEMCNLCWVTRYTLQQRSGPKWEGKWENNLLHCQTNGDNRALFQQLRQNLLNLVITNEWPNVSNNIIS